MHVDLLFSTQLTEETWRLEEFCEFSKLLFKGG